MAEHSSGSKGFAKVLSKKVYRTKEKVLQNLGKADKTTDEGYDVNVANFSQQQAAANRLQKELKNYLSQVKAMSAASNSLYTTISETYEGEWTGFTEMVSSVTHLRALWEDYMENLTNNVQHQLSVYIGRFPDVRNKMNKRGRKLVDYDRARHSLNDLNHAKKRDEAKIQKATVEMEEAKRVYDELNNELRDELPDLYESRINTLAGTFLNLFMFEGKFEDASSKVKLGLEDVTQKLQKETTKTVFFSPAPYGIQNRNGPGGGLDSTGLNLSELESTPARKVDSQRISNSGGSTESEVDKRSTSRTSTGGSEDGEMGYKGKNVYTPLNGELEHRPPAPSAEYEAIHTGAQDVYEAYNPEDDQHYSDVQVEGTSAGEARVEVSADKTTENISAQLTTGDNETAAHVEVKTETPKESTTVSETTRDDVKDDDHVESHVGKDEPVMYEKEGHPSDLPTEATSMTKQVVPQNVENTYDSISDDDDSPRHQTDDNTQGVRTSALDDSSGRMSGDLSSQTDSRTSGVYQPQPASRQSAGEDQDYAVPISNKPVPPPEGVLFQVLATHAYAGEDIDELTFEVGDVVNVVPFDDPEDQDEGWLYGYLVNKTSEDAGVFPENFTKRI